MHFILKDFARLTALLMEEIIAKTKRLPFWTALQNNRVIKLIMNNNACIQACRRSITIGF